MNWIKRKLEWSERKKIVAESEASKWVWRGDIDKGNNLATYLCLEFSRENDIYNNNDNNEGGAVMTTVANDTHDGNAIAEL